MCADVDVALRSTDGAKSRNISDAPTAFTATRTADTALFSGERGAGEKLDGERHTTATLDPTEIGREMLP
jgi:hypothetical protein